jgi:hypothetical protein
MKAERLAMAFRPAQFAPWLSEGIAPKILRGTGRIIFGNAEIDAENGASWPAVSRLYTPRRYLLRTCH